MLKFLLGAGSSAAWLVVVAAVATLFEWTGPSGTPLPVMGVYAIGAGAIWLFLYVRSLGSIRYRLSSQAALFGCVLSLLMFGLVDSMVTRHRRAEAVEAMGFSRHMPAYVKDYGPPAGGEPLMGAGKMLIVDLREGEVDDLYFALRPEVRATSPEEVETLAQIRWEKRVVARYSNGAPASRWFAFVGIVDLASGRTLADQEFAGSEPPSRTRGRSGASGDKPGGVILERLHTLYARRAR